jgi:PAS domain S-box-containing protein
MGRVDSGRPDMTSSAIAPDVLLGAIVEMSNDAIVTCNAKGSVTSWSVTAERLFGCLADDVLDGPLELLFPEHLTDEVRRIIATVLAGDRIRNFETEILRPDGMPLPVSLSLSPVFDAERVPLGAVVLARDITEQHLAQATLAEIDARMEEGEALAHIGSWLWDLRTGAVQWSAEFHRIHGVDPLDFDGTFESHLGLIDAEDRDGVREAMVESVESGRQYNAEYRIVQPGGGVRTVQVRAQPTFGSTGKAVGLRGIGQDVTPAGTPNPTD